MNSSISSKPIPRATSTAVILFSRVTSFIFHPFFMTTLAALIVNFFLRDFSERFKAGQFRPWLGQLAVFTIVLPFMSVFLLRRSGLITNTRMHLPRDRFLPLLAAFVVYGLAYWLVASMVPYIWVHSLLAGSCVAIVIVFVINTFYKVSVHTTAAAIPAGICLILALNGTEGFLVPFAIAALMAIAVGLVRWWLGAHTLGQILLGYVVGLFSQLAGWIYFYK